MSYWLSVMLGFVEKITLLPSFFPIAVRFREVNLGHLGLFHAVFVRQRKKKRKALLVLTYAVGMYIRVFYKLSVEFLSATSEKFGIAWNVSTYRDLTLTSIP